MVYHSGSQNETEELGRKLGQLLTHGSVVALAGELGSGKTCIARGIVAAVCPESAHMVASPTFAIMNEYPGPVPVYHFDFYRLSGSQDISELGFEDYFQGDGICLIEWSERMGDLMPENHLNVCLEHAGLDERTIRFEAFGEVVQTILRQLNSLIKSS